ncbi:HalD/BesD family halogenase [Paracoccus zhejiangensis]|uniref:2OG-Fe(II) oxygenase n=1 Tax=Paracoccus zhejiangensis TaxID=1077935 RepID=A0A2H5EWW6_9RHOB|nr:2OG-Fe(II) oxygenase [Paracoccus zhejiangensis]AUH63808.1 2OG-Fe(II) oxygenase [Paracoccus zhejiangensis]
MNHLLDLDTYPIDRPDSPACLALVESCRARLAEDGMFDLPGFLRPEATEAAARAAAPTMAREGFRHARRHNIYFRDEVEGLTENHPAMVKVETVNHTLCADQLQGNPVIALYEWPPFVAFLAAIMGKAALYPMEDPMARVNIQASRDGEALNWHFDRSEFTTTILLQAPDAGGELEYRKDLRAPDQPNYDGVAAVLRGEDPQVRRIALKPGALNVFQGVNTLHRVVPVRGATERMVAIFAYFDRPGVAMTAREQQGFYGRATASA